MPSLAPHSFSPAMQILLKSPVLLESELAGIQADPVLRTQTFELRYTSGAPGAMKKALADLCGGWHRLWVAGGFDIGVGSGGLRVRQGRTWQ
jgi:hypothetical protein